MKNTTLKRNMILILSLGSIAVCLMAVLSIVLGSADISSQVVFDAIFNFDPSNLEHQVIVELRIPRTIGDIAIGAAFAVAGAIMQGITRNPLADTGLLGINAGAAFGLAVSFALFPGLSYGGVVFFSFLGAAFATIVVYGVISFNRGKLSPVRLVLAGSVVGIFLSSLSQAIAMYFKIGQEITFWTAGGVAGIRMEQLRIIIPFIAIALIASIFLSRSISMLSLGEDVALGLGLNINRAKIMCILVVLSLAGTSVALAGSISFVGLIIPHIVRYFVGVEYQKIIPCSIVTGSLFMLTADLISRTINPPYEVPVGLIFSLIGVPFFLYISRTERRSLGG